MRCRKGQMHYGKHITLPEVAIYIRMYATGALECGRKEIENLVSAARHALETWEPSSHPRYARFDAAVKELLEAALEEFGEN